MKKKEEKMRAAGILKKKARQAIADREIHISKKERDQQKKNDDLWAEKPDVANDWVAKNTRKHISDSTGLVKKPPPKNKGKIKSVLPPIEIPHPGTSYNPSYEDHKALLDDVIQAECKIIKEEDHINRVTKDMFTKVTQQQKDVSKLSL